MREGKREECEHVRLQKGKVGVLRVNGESGRKADIVAGRRKKGDLPVHKKGTPERVASREETVRRRLPNSMTLGSSVNKQSL